MLDKEFIEKIEDMTDEMIQEVDGRKYSKKTIVPVYEPTATALKVATLTSLVDYLTSNRDGLNLTEILVHVKSTDEVAVMGPLFGKWRQRETILVATRELHQDKMEFGRYLDNENFIVKIQSQFVPTPVTAQVLRIIGNMVSERVMKASDDGVTQSVEARAGVVLAKEATIPNPVLLRPFRTFPEVDQPESPFILRVRQGRAEGELPSCALFEADGGAWRLEAIKGIKGYLGIKLKGVTVIG